MCPAEVFSRITLASLVSFSVAVLSVGGTCEPLLQLSLLFQDVTVNTICHFIHIGTNRVSAEYRGPVNKFGSDSTNPEKVL
jgi:hypothetical protein